MGAYGKAILVSLGFALIVFSCHEAYSECLYCPPVNCIENSDCYEGCVCIGEEDGVGICMSTVGNMEK